MDGKTIGMIRMKDRIENLEISTRKENRNPKNRERKRHIDVENWGKVKALLKKEKGLKCCKIILM